jgi:autotransporter family porin
VQAVNATTAPTAFVQSGRIVAGAYEYFLFRGGVSPGSQESWFLRSTLIPGSQPAAQQPFLPGQPPPAPLTGPAVPLFRPEVPVYAAVPGTTRLLLLSILSTFHERRGEQSLLQGKGIVPAAWGRFLGQRVERQWAGAAAPEFDGSILGLEVGVDLASFEIASGHRDRVGLFFAYAQASGDISGFAIGEQQEVGHERINSYGLGGYWTHIGPTGWYIDSVLTGLWFNGDANSNFGTGIDVSGNSMAASIEAGYPIPLTRQISLEPQAQFIWQHFWLDDEQDAFSTVAFNTPEGFTARAGLRLRGSFSAETILWQPYVKVNLWQGFGGDDELLFGGSDTISSEQQTTALEAGGGVVTKIGEVVALYATLSWTNDLDGNTLHNLGGNFGLRVAW